MNRLVSIVVNCYNRADLVCTALDSVWKQIYRPIELIIVDDGSKDNTFEVVLEWVGKHPNTEDFTTVAKTFPNGKLCLARNRGLELAHGEYIQYVDDDDWLYPEAIVFKMMYAQANPKFDLIVNQLEYYKNGMVLNHTRIVLPEHGENMVSWLLSHECLISPVLMFKTETLRRIGAWKVGLIFADDMEITVRLAILGGQIGIVDKFLSGYRIHNSVRQCTTIRDRLSDTFISDLYNDLYRLAVKNNVATQAVRQAFAEHLIQDGYDMINHGRYEAAKRCFKVAKEVDSDVGAFKDDGIPLTWHLRAYCHKIRISLKAFLKKILGR